MEEELQKLKLRVFVLKTTLEEYANPKNWDNDKWLRNEEGFLLAQKVLEKFKKKP